MVSDLSRPIVSGEGPSRRLGCANEVNRRGRRAAEFRRGCHARFSAQLERSPREENISVISPRSAEPQRPTGRLSGYRRPDQCCDCNQLCCTTHGRQQGGWHKLVVAATCSLAHKTNWRRPPIRALNYRLVAKSIIQFAYSGIVASETRAAVCRGQRGAVTVEQQTESKATAATIDPNRVRSWLRWIRCWSAHAAWTATYTRRATGPSMIRPIELKCFAAICRSVRGGPLRRAWCTAGTVVRH